MSEWTGEERRAMKQQPQVPPHDVSLHDIWVLLQTHIAAEELHNKQIIRGFPKNKHNEPDYDGHADYHQRLIERAIKIEERNDRIVEKFLAGGIWATVVVLATFVLNGALGWLKDHLK
jgi:hypothetical protein